MYVGHRYTARVEGTVIRKFECTQPGCGFVSLARVRTKGEGQGVSPYFLREEGAKQSANSEAEAKALENADTLVSLARCPACDRQDEGKVSSEKLGAYGLGALIAFGCGLLGAFVVRDGGFGFVAGGVIGVVCAIIHVTTQSWRWNEVDERVEVLSYHELEALLDERERAAA